LKIESPGGKLRFLPNKSPGGHALWAKLPWGFTILHFVAVVLAIFLFA
jgi:hypothetical protein